jgi:hypothetical protein
MGRGPDPSQGAVTRRRNRHSVGTRRGPAPEPTVAGGRRKAFGVSDDQIAKSFKTWTGLSDEGRKFVLGQAKGKQDDKRAAAIRRRLQQLTKTQTSAAKYNEEQQGKYRAQGLDPKNAPTKGYGALGAPKKKKDTLLKMTTRGPF